MTPQASLPPALPVVKESGESPLPRSSSFSWTTTALPIMQWSPSSSITLSVKLISAMPASLATMLPRSPT